MIGGRGLVLASVTVMLLSSAVAIAYVQFETRNKFNELQTMQAKRDALQVEWERLLLEQGTHATPGLIEQIAREELSMTVPSVKDIQIIDLGGRGAVR